MADKIIGKLPEFSSDETPTEETGQEEEKKATPEEEVEEEKETPSEPPAEETPAEEPEEKPEGEGDDGGQLIRQTEALKLERERLLAEIRDLRGERRDLKQQQITQVETAIDELKDVYPADVELIEKVLKTRGYIRQEDVDKRIYEENKNQQLESFLNKHPEYKPENDPKDTNWQMLQRELEYYRMPKDPKKVGDVLERAHKALTGSYSVGQNVSAKKHLAKVAGSGGSGSKGPSSGGGTLSPEHKEAYRRGGWSEEEIKNIEKNLPE